MENIPQLKEMILNLNDAALNFHDVLTLLQFCGETCRDGKTELYMEVISRATIAFNISQITLV